jgi:hypothetical protein
MALVQLFWQRVDEALAAKPRGRKDLKQALERINKARDKNTYTRWFREPRPDLRMSDLEDLANALAVPPNHLVAPNGALPRPAPQQLELPFEADSRTAELELECTDKSLIVRPRTR